MINYALMESDETPNTELDFLDNLDGNVYKYVSGLAEADYSSTDLNSTDFDENYLKLAFNYCHEIIKHHSKSFGLASSLLDNERRDAVAALYSFCRITDDLIDKETSHREELLQSWKENVNRVIPNVADPVNLAWLYTRTKYKIPENYIYQLIDGVKMDIHKTR